MQRSESIRFRVTSEEKAEIERRAGDEGMSAYVRDRVLGKPVPDTAPSVSDSEGLDAGSEREGRDTAAMPAKTWGARVRQLAMQGVPRMAAERIADQELRGR